MINRPYTKIKNIVSIGVCISPDRGDVNPTV